MTTAALPRAKRARTGISWRKSIPFYLAISPWLVGLLLFSLGPILASFGISFLSWEIITPAKFVGLKNYVMFTRDPLIRQAFRVTFTYVLLAVPLNIIGAMTAALLLNQRMRGERVFRTVFYLPCVVAGVAMAQAWKIILNPDLGILNYVLGQLGLPSLRWIASETWALPSIVLISMWGIGGNMVIYLAVLQSIPSELYDAAKVDGAGSLASLRHVTLPMLTPAIFFGVVMGIIGGFQVFTQSFIMTNGGPGNATLFYLLYLYRQAFEYFRMGYAAAMAWVLFVIILGITVVVFKSSPLWVYYEAEVKQ